MLPEDVNCQGYRTASWSRSTTLDGRQTTDRQTDRTDTDERSYADPNGRLNQLPVYPTRYSHTLRSFTDVNR